MSVESVAAFLEQNKREIKILKYDDTSTVAKAANALGVTPGEIAKSLLYSYVFPAAGASNTAIKLSVDELQELTKAQWVDVVQ